MGPERDFMSTNRDSTKSPGQSIPGVSIKAENLSFAYNATPILDHASFTLDPHQITFLVGENGVGKSTLLKILARELEATSGTISASKPAYTAEYVPQITPQLPNREQSAIHFLLSARGIDKLLQQLEYFYQNTTNAQVLKEYQQFLDEYNETEIYRTKHRAEEILDRFVNLSPNEYVKKINELSGGQKTRLYLARALLTQPDLLLLDEPDNNLDYDARRWLLEEIRRFPNTILIVGHRISFVDQLAQKILELRRQDHKIYTYTGNYSDFLEIRSKQADIEEKERKQILKERMELKQAIQRELKLAQRSERRKQKKRDKDKIAANYKSGRATQKHQATARKLKKQLEELPKPEETKNLQFKMKIEPAYCSEGVLSVKNLAKAYHFPLFSEVNLAVRRGERLAITGPNASGKSTFLKLISGEVEPDAGEINLGNGVITGYFPQEQEGLPEMTVLEYFRKTVSLHETDLRRILQGHFLFSENEIFTKLSNLSAGERARTFFAKFALSYANLLLLDEPTNNLDPRTKEAVTNLLEDYQGTILVVSHDWEFLERLKIDRTLILGGGKINFQYGLHKMV